MSEIMYDRDKIPESCTWNLHDIFPSDESWNEEYEALMTVPEDYVAYAGHLGDSAETLLAYLKHDDDISVRLEKLMGYANCSSDTDTADSKYQDMRSKAVSVYVTIAQSGSFATPEILAIPEERLNAFYAECPALEEYRRPLYNVRRKAAHILSAEEERIIAAMGEVAQTPENICSTFRDADLKFRDVLDADGTAHRLTTATYMPLMESKDRVLRRNTFEEVYARYGEFKNTVAATFDAQFKTLCFFANVRKYPSTLASSLDDTEVPESVYHNLIDTVHNNLDKFYRYVELRKKLLGLDELHLYDMFTSMVSDADMSIGYDEAKGIVLDALSVMGSDYTALLRRGFDDRWIDVYPSEGKRSGAYSSGSSRPHPYVLLNHNNTLDATFTIAHELGHALHSYYSTENQPVCTSDYTIFVAEVASTCNEILLMRYMLAHTEDRRQKAYLINYFLDQFRSTLFRQTMFAEFELQMGEMAENGEALTADALCEKYYALNKLYFGDGIVLDEQIALEWARIPHFFYDYYVFQYATGFAAAAAISERILNEGETAVADYKRFLSSGGSDDPISLLKIAGVDMSTPAPVNAALELYDRLITEMDELSLSLTSPDGLANEINSR